MNTKPLLFAFLAMGVQGAALADTKPKALKPLLDPAVMRAAGCEVNPGVLEEMPAKIGNASLPASIRSKLKMLAYIAPSRAKVDTAPGVIESRDGKKSLLQVKELLGVPPTTPPPCLGMVPSRLVAGVGRGTMRSAFVAFATAPIDVWRVYSGKPSACGHAKMDGSWWSLSDPRRLGKAAARKRNGVCLSWNDFTHVVHCKLKAGAPLAIGPTESVARATCSCDAKRRRTSGDGVDDAWVAGDHYPADDSTLQVYVNTFAAKGLAPLMTCDAPVVWK